MEKFGYDTVAVQAWPGPQVVTPAGAVTLQQWAGANRESVDATLSGRGAILFRGFKVDSVDAFRAAAATLIESLLDYVYRSTPRTALADGVFTATEYPATASIPMHNENAYQRDWPMRLVFGCIQPAETGGETPLALTSNVTRRIDPAIVRMFEDRKVMYVRNYGSGVDLPWQTTFQTDSQQEVESFCQKHSIDCEWLPEGRLRTRQVCQGVAQHPLTGETLWFNQAHLFHSSSLGKEDQQAMLEVFGEANLPRNAFFGDGGSIDEGLLDHVRRAYESETHVFSWERGDLLLLDNMQVAHSRRRFTGKRQVLVAMGTPFSSAC